MKPVDIGAGLKRVISDLELASLDYMIVGSVAGTVYGEPRLTNDLDLVVSTSQASAKNILDAFDGKDFYLPPLEIVSQEITRCGQINLLHQTSGLKVDLMFLKQTRHGVEEFSRRRRLEILRGLVPWIASPEDIIIAKLRFYREGESQKHLVDIRGILANTPIDHAYLSGWLKELDLLSYFKDV
jgi:hypothetical protein